MAITLKDLKFRVEYNVKGTNGKKYDRLAIAYVPLDKEREVVVATTFFEDETLEDVFKEVKFRENIVRKMNLI